MAAVGLQGEAVTSAELIFGFPADGQTFAWDIALEVPGATPTDGSNGVAHVQIDAVSGEAIHVLTP
jgi:hypothetical protein